MDKVFAVAIARQGHPGEPETLRQSWPADRKVIRGTTFAKRPAPRILSDRKVTKRGTSSPVHRRSTPGMTHIDQQARINSGIQPRHPHTLSNPIDVRLIAERQPGEVSFERIPRIDRLELRPDPLSLFDLA